MGVVLRARIHSRPEHGADVLLGSQDFPKGTELYSIVDALILKFWDPRLDAASCRAVVDVEEIELDEES